MNFLEKDKNALNVHSLRLINDTYYDPVISSIMNLLYRGIQFNLGRIYYEIDGKITELTEFYQHIFNRHWKGLTRRIGDWIIRFGFVVIGTKKVKTKLTHDVKTLYPENNRNNVLFPIPYIPEIETVDLSAENIDGIYTISAQLKKKYEDNNNKAKRFKVYQSNASLTEFSLQDRVYKTEMYVIAKQYKRFLFMQQCIENGVRTKFMPPLFVESSPETKQFSQTDLDDTLNAEVFFEKMKEGEKKKRSRIFEKDEAVADDEYEDVTDNARLLKRGFTISRIQPQVELPYNMEFHYDNLSKIAGNILGIPFQTITGGGKFSGSAKIDSRRTAASQQQLASKIQDIIRSMWTDFYEKQLVDDNEVDSNIVFHLPVQTSFDIDDIVAIKENQLVPNDEVLNQLIESIAGNNAN